jgi:stage V sporulation protein SpoVS
MQQQTLNSMRVAKSTENNRLGEAIARWAWTTLFSSETALTSLRLEAIGPKALVKAIYGLAVARRHLARGPFPNLWGQSRSEETVTSMGERTRSVVEVSFIPADLSPILETARIALTENDGDGVARCHRHVLTILPRLHDIALARAWGIGHICLKIGELTSGDFETRLLPQFVSIQPGEPHSGKSRIVSGISLLAIRTQQRIATTT